MRAHAPVLGLLAAAALLVGCGGDDAPSAEEDRAAITQALVDNEVAGPERCDRIYTDAYLAENWNENVTAYGPGTPVEKCRAQTRPDPTVTAADVAVSAIAIDGDTATARSAVRASPPVGFRLERDGDDWRISGFTD